MLITKQISLLVFIFCVSLLGQKALAHPMPNSTLAMRVETSGLHFSLSMPVSELMPALGASLKENGPLTTQEISLLKSYVLAHFRITNSNHVDMPVHIAHIAKYNTKDSIRGIYSEINIEGNIDDATAPHWQFFTIISDIIIHQVPNHAMMVTLEQNWSTLSQSSAPQAVGVIQLNIPTGTIPPLKVALTSLNWQENAWRMLQLGIQHIAAGADHLMFLLLLLLTAPLRQNKHEWTIDGGTNYSLRRLLQMVTAFTLGHSLTLLTGGLGWQPIPSKWIEVTIAVSILVSAVHAWRPFFFGKETRVAAGFGLIHGMAFSGSLLHLQLPTWQLVLSIAAFNIGIEVMQLVVVLLATPWLLLISKSNAGAYVFVRKVLAVLAAIAAFGWILERITDTPNIVSSCNNHLVSWAPGILAVLALLAIILYLLNKKNFSQNKVS